MRLGRVLVAGSIAYDRIFDYAGRFRDSFMPDKLHSLNVSFLVSDVRESYGGTAGNIGFSLRLLGLPVSLVGAVGHDFGLYSAWLRRHGIDLSAVTHVSSRPTASAYIMTDRDDNQIAAFQPSAMSVTHLPLPRLRRLEDSLELAILAPGNPDLMFKLADYCVRRKLPYLFDPGQIIPAIPPKQLRRLLGRAAGLISNDYELSLIVRSSGYSEKKLRRDLPFIVTTLGSRGARITAGSLDRRVPAAVPARVVDPTGAGDAFRAGFVAGLIRRFPLVTCVRMGTVASVYTVERQGTQTHSYTVPEFVRRFRKNYNDNLLLM